MTINENQNEKSIKALKKGLDTSWDLFLYGDKTSNTKPGNIRVYGTIAGQREVLKERKALRAELSSEEQQK